MPNQHPEHAAERSPLTLWQREYFRLTQEEGWSHSDTTEYLDRVGLGRPARREVWQQQQRGERPQSSVHKRGVTGRR